MNGRANWFWQPDKSWVNDINTTNLRSINGIRMAVALVAMGLLAFGWATWHAVPHCPVEPCESTTGQIRAADFAHGIFDSLCIFIGAVMGISVAAGIGKRLTDTDHVERKELAKAKVAAVTSEHQALPPVVAYADKVEVKTPEPVPQVPEEDEEHRWRGRQNPTEGLG